MSKIWTNKADSLLMLYALGGGGFLFSIGTTFNGGVGLTVKYLAVPLAIVVISFAYIRGRYLPTKEKVKAWLFLCFLLYPMILLFAWPYVLAFNALTATGETVAVTGTITRKSTAGAKSVAYVVSIRNPQTGQDSQVAVSKEDYESMSLGDSYQFCYYRGRFDIPFFWRFSGQPAC